MPRPARRTTLTTAAAVLAAAGALGAVGLLVSRTAHPETTDATPTPAWAETAWPFPADPWGKGKAYRCPAESCGAEIVVSVRAKLGLCGCVTTIDDDDVDRVGDVDLIAPERTALGPGQAIAVRSMKGRSRSYALGGRGAAAKSAIAVALHERCDMIVATAALGVDQPARQEQAVIEFLRGDAVTRWAEVTLGL